MASDDEGKQERLARNRKRACDELLSTERSYRDTVETIITVFQKPLQEHTEDVKQLASDEELRSLFSCIQVIHAISSQLCKDLERVWEKRSSPNETIASVMVSFAPFLKSYTEYINNYENALSVYEACMKRKAFNEFIEEQTDKEDCRGLDLIALLITPVQRIPRYSLLLKEILKNTPEDHPEYDDFSAALEDINEVAVEVNEQKRVFEDKQAVLTLMSCMRGSGKTEDDSLEDVRARLVDRRFRREGALRKETTDKSFSDRYFFLFDNLLLYAAVQREKPPRRFTFRRALPLNRVEVLDVPDFGSRRFEFTVNRAGEWMLRLRASSEEEKQGWIADIKAVVTEGDSSELEFRRVQSKAMVRKLSLKESHRVIEDFKSNREEEEREKGRRLPSEYALDTGDEDEPTGRPSINFRGRKNYRGSRFLCFKMTWTDMTKVLCPNTLYQLWPKATKGITGLLCIPCIPCFIAASINADKKEEQRAAWAATMEADAKRNQGSIASPSVDRRASSMGIDLSYDDVLE